MMNRSRTMKWITYDGDDNDPSSSYFGGLGSVDLTQGGLYDRFALQITSITTSSATLRINVFRPFRGSTLLVNLPTTAGIFELPFASFTRDSIFSSAVDFHDVGFIEFDFAMNNGESLTIDSITSVPEPSSFWLMLLPGLGLLAKRSFGIPMPAPVFRARKTAQGQHQQNRE